MNYRRTKLWLLTAVLLLAAAGLTAQSTTGRLTGTTTLDDAPLPGVTVTISSPSLQGTRTTVTDQNGNYTFGALPPGTYQIVFSIDGMQSVTKVSTVNLATTAEENAQMRLSTVAEAITVTADQPSTIETAEMQTSVDSELVEELPIARTLLGTVSLAPGVTSTGPGNATVISGAPAYDSTYYIDGSVVNEVLRGQPLDLFIEDAIQETTIQTGAISAEFGRFTGGVVTAVTKAGGNEYSGSLRDSINNPAWTSVTPLDEDEGDNDIQQTFEATLGGRIVRDRLWFFGAGRYQERTTDSFFYQSTETFDQPREQRRLEGKLTAAITPRHSIVASALDLQDQINNNNFGNTWEPSALDAVRETPQEKLAFNYNGIFTNNLLLEAVYSESELRFVGSGGPPGDFANATNVYDYFGNAFLGAPSFGAVLGDKVRSSENTVVTGRYFLSTPQLGTHNLAAGFDEFTHSMLENNSQSGSDFTVWTFSAPTRQNGVVTPRFARGDWIIWFPILQESQGNAFTTRSYFLNDRWDLNSKWSFNVGVRYDQNEGENQAGISVADDSTVSPGWG
jgi:outer membrane receptor for ferrienterochelin and colicin